MSELKNKLTNLKKENQNNTSNINKLSSENNALKKDYKTIVSRNMKLNNLVKTLESFIENQKDDIENKKDEIAKLQDAISHH